jgi:hypothetical protein
MRLLALALLNAVIWLHENTVCAAVQARGVNSQITTTHSGTIDVGACSCGLFRVWDDRGTFRCGQLGRFS